MIDSLEKLKRNKIRYTQFVYVTNQIIKNLDQLKDELIDYVILHELVHTRKKDHSKAFWAELYKIMGDGKEMASRLRKYGIGLY